MSSILEAANLLGSDLMPDPRLWKGPERNLTWCSSPTPYPGSVGGWAESEGACA